MQNKYVAFGTGLVAYMGQISMEQFLEFPLVEITEDWMSLEIAI